MIIMKFFVMVIMNGTLKNGIIFKKKNLVMNLKFTILNGKKFKIRFIYFKLIDKIYLYKYKFIIYIINIL